MKIICDTRENTGAFLFRAYADVEVINRKLDTADYSLEGFENIVVIDRKKTPAELCTNLGADSARFNRELDRMRSIEFSYFVCEFPYSYLEIFPKNSGIPKYRWKKLKITGAYLRKRIKEIEEEYPNIKFIFCNSSEEAEDITYQILKEYNGRKA